MKFVSVTFPDVNNGTGFRTTLWVAGCTHKCKGCHNPETWDFDGGKEFTYDVLNEVIDALTANGVERSLSILGGEPLCEENVFLTLLIIKTVKERLPNTKIYIWTGYYYDELIKRTSDSHLKAILDYADYLIDGPYV